MTVDLHYRIWANPFHSQPANIPWHALQQADCMFQTEIASRISELSAGLNLSDDNEADSTAALGVVELVPEYGGRQR